MAICGESTFAPVLAVLPYDDLDQVLAAQDHCPYGLGASVFTRDPARAAALAAQWKAGFVSINDVIAGTGHPATPLAGRGASGWGVTQGLEGLLEMTVPQVVSTRRGSWRPHYDAMDSTRWTRLATFQAMLQWGHAASWWSRLRGGWRLMRQLMR
jgi:aldehyde dehydrogenase (NAD+)